MEEDEEGFKYPSIDDSVCIGCGQCIKFCPAVQKNKLNPIDEAIVTANPDKSRELYSSSGGMFPKIAELVLKQGGYVCGAKMMCDLSLRHIVTDQMSDVLEMQGSRYMQSDMGTCFREIKQLVESKKKVMFIGTPCQVAGLKQYINGHENELICVDLICHGVPSQDFFKKYIVQTYSTRWGKISNVKFREKTKYEKDVYRLVLSTARGTKRIYSTEDAYYSAFEKGQSLRESCYVCPYARPERIGDITLGDCANKEEHMSFGFSQVLSSVFINTYVGKMIWQQLKQELTFEKANLEKEILLNKQLHMPVKRPEIRNQIYKDFMNMDRNMFSHKYKVNITYKLRLERFLKRLLPLSVKAKLRGYKK